MNERKKLFVIVIAGIMVLFLAGMMVYLSDHWERPHGIKVRFFEEEKSPRYMTPGSINIAPDDYEKPQEEQTLEVYSANIKPTKAKATKKKIQKPDTPYIDGTLPKKLQDYIYKRCRKDKELYFLTMAVIKAESSFDANATGIDGHDIGLMQIRDCNLEELQSKFGAVNLYDPYDNVKCGIHILKNLRDKYEHKCLVLMAYNCGEAGARRLWKQDIYSTVYSDEVSEYYNEFEKTARKVD